MPEPNSTGDPSLRDWLTRKQRETKRGRAELKLTERASVWSAKPENKQLPTIWEWISFRRWTDKKRWTGSEKALMRTAARVHAQNWGSALLVLLILGGVIGFLFQQQSPRSRQEKTLGPSVPVIIDKLMEMKRLDLIRPELECRFSAANKPREKLSLAFVLALFGQVESAYLVAHIDSIEEGDTANFIAALGRDRDGSIAKLREAFGECVTPELYRRKARLAMAALAVGDTALPIDACEFEGRTDHSIRTCFIDEFPRWELDRDALVATVKETTSSALRSAVCLGLGQIPVKQISTEDKNRIAELATKWYSLPDSSTHSASAWLLRQWELKEPTLSNATHMVADRDWFVNSQGVTFVRITPPSVEQKAIPDPLEQFRQALIKMENASEEEKGQANFRYRQGQNLYQTGQYEPALTDLDAVLKKELDDSMKGIRNEVEQLRLFALARLKRTEEAEAALAKWIASKPSPDYLDYAESLVPLWLGRKDAAVERLEKGLAEAESADRETLYNLACAVALFAASESATAEEKRSWSDRALTLLERWSQSNQEDRNRMRTDPDLLVLHSDARLLVLAGERPTVPEAPYWLANREVTRGEFETFLRDTGYTERDPIVESKASPDERISPTMDHPAQNVSWYAAVTYSNWLSSGEGRRPAYRFGGKEKIKDYIDQEVEVDKWELDESANGYRLPKEWEWDYACRAGTKTSWSPGSDKSLLAAYCRMDQFAPWGSAEECGKRLPNAWGLHDIHGNVWEWCWGVSDSRGSFRVYRGGGYYMDAEGCASASWAGYTPLYRDSGTGFRLALSQFGIPE